MQANISGEDLEQVNLDKFFKIISSNVNEQARNLRFNTNKNYNIQLHIEFTKQESSEESQSGINQRVESYYTQKEYTKYEGVETPQGLQKVIQNTQFRDDRFAFQIDVETKPLASFFSPMFTTKASAYFKELNAEEKELQRQSQAANVRPKEAKSSENISALKDLYIMSSCEKPQSLHSKRLLTTEDSDNEEFVAAKFRLMPTSANDQPSCRPFQALLFTPEQRWKGRNIKVHSTKPFPSMKEEEEKQGVRPLPIHIDEVKEDPQKKIAVIDEKTLNELSGRKMFRCQQTKALDEVKKKIISHKRKQALGNQTVRAKADTAAKEQEAKGRERRQKFDQWNSQKSQQMQEDRSKAIPKVKKLEVEYNCIYCETRFTPKDVKYKLKCQHSGHAECVKKNSGLLKPGNLRIVASDLICKYCIE